MKFLNLPHIVKYIVGTRNNFSKLKNPFRKTNTRQKAISYIGPSIWNSLPGSIKTANILTLSNIMSQGHYLTWITHNVIMWICVCVSVYVYISVGVCIYTYAYILAYFPLTYSFSCCWVFFSLTLFSHFRSNLREHNENRRFYPFCAIPATVDAIHICLQ